MAQRFTGSQLDRRVQLQQPVVARDPAYGSATTTWSVVATVWAQRLEATGGTATSADQRVASRTVRFLIRYRADVRADWRIVEGGRRFRITSQPAEQGRKSGLVIECEETSDA